MFTPGNAGARSQVFYCVLVMFLDGCRLSAATLWDIGVLVVLDYGSLILGILFLQWLERSLKG